MANPKDEAVNTYSRWRGNGADEFTVYSQVGEVECNLTPEQKASNARHDEIMKKARKEGGQHDAASTEAQKQLRKYQLPEFLSVEFTPAIYEKWLRRKAAAHVKRDKKRGNSTAIGEAYRMAIHRAVIQSGGHDHYTGERLDWSLINQYSNDKSHTGKRGFKATLALLPTVDHVGDGLGEADFKICGWRTNDAKSDLSHQEFVDLCRRVVRHFDHLSIAPASRTRYP